jgi:hypothetical protein
LAALESDAGPEAKRFSPGTLYPGRGPLVGQQLGRFQHEDLTEQIRMLVDRGHGRDHLPAKLLLDDLPEAVAQDLLKFCKLLNDRVPSSSFEVGRLGCGEPAAHHAHDQVVA